MLALRSFWSLVAFAVVAGGATALLMSQETEARDYWAIGLPTYEGGSMPSTIISATYYGDGILPGSGADVATFCKAGLAPCQALPTLAGSTSNFAMDEFYQGTQISPLATYLVSTQTPDWEVMQTTAIYGVSATTDATRLIPEDHFGSEYVVATYQDRTAYLNPNPDYFAVVAIKDGTTVKVTTSSRTAASTVPPGAAGCTTVPKTVCAMNGGPYTYVLNRGEALFVESGDGGPTCIVAVLSCPPNDLTGTKIVATTPVGVFAGAYCVNMSDTSCDAINEQLMPDAMAGQTYVICSARQSGTGELDLLRIRAVSGTASLSFATPTTGGALGGMVSSSAYTSFYFNRDTVVTASADVHVLQYLASSNVPPRQSATQNPVTLLGDFGDPSYMEVSSQERTQTDHWFYANPSWDNFLYVGGPTGTILGIQEGNGAPVPVAGVSRPIGGSGYSCQTPLLPGGTGGTYKLTANQPVAAQVLGLGYFTSYFYDTGSQPFVPPPPPPPTGPTALFKPTARASGCGDRPVTFADLSSAGSSPIVDWTWDLGDGTVSKDQNPVHTYSEPGSYQAFLTVTDASGLSDTYSDTFTSTIGDPCREPTKPEDNGQVPRPPRDDVDPEVAEGDVDSDGRLNAVDNCVDTPNASQADMDGDLAGDACDGDMDNDGTLNAVDNCFDAVHVTDVVNVAQRDFDADGAGDVCDGDLDGDGVGNDADNCREVPNAAQADQDGNLAGDACDTQVGLAQDAAPQAGSVERSPGGLQALASGGGLGTVLLVAGLVAAAAVALVVVLAVRGRK